MKLLREIADEMARSAKWYALAAFLCGTGTVIWALCDPSILEPISR